MGVFTDFRRPEIEKYCEWILPLLNQNEPKRDKFEQGYRSLNLLWETLHPIRSWWNTRRTTYGSLASGYTTSKRFTQRAINLRPTQPMGQKREN